MRRPLFTLLLAASAGWAGCSSDRTGWDHDGSGEFAEADASVDAACSGVVCSRDLRSVRDCRGNVVEECGADTACGNGQCVAPCSAAAINEGSVGCSFSIPAPTSKELGIGSCFAFFVANNWTSPATLHVQFKGEEQSLDGAVWVPSVSGAEVTHTKLDGPIPPGGGAVVFVSSENTGQPYHTDCPPLVKPLFSQELAINGTGIGNALFVSVDVPVSTYSIFPYGGARSFFPSAMLMFPTTSFRKNYVVASAWGGQNDGFGRGVLPGGYPMNVESGRPTLQIVAIEDDTSIDLLPKADIVGGTGIHPGTRSEIANYRLKRGEVLQLTQNNDLTGSVIETSKPVGVFGGSTCMNVPGDVSTCDNANAQTPPVSAWGHEYAVLPTPNRAAWMSHGVESERDPSPIRIVGAANGTKLAYEPFRPEGAPDTLELGQLAVFFGQQPFVVRSQDAEHPFYVASVMTSGGATSTNLGDPEFVMSVATDQWLDSYGFFSDYTYALSAVFVTRRKVNGAFQDVNLDCAGALTGWKSMTEDFEWTYVELSRFGAPQSYPAGSCTDGAHRIRSEGPFAMTVWGVGAYASYAYPGGTGLRPVTNVQAPVH